MQGTIPKTAKAAPRMTDGQLWWRTDNGDTLYVLDVNDISPLQLTPNDACFLCRGREKHSEVLHDEVVFGDVDTTPYYISDQKWSDSK